MLSVLKTPIVPRKRFGKNRPIVRRPSSRAGDAEGTGPCPACAAGTAQTTASSTADRTVRRSM